MAIPSGEDLLLPVVKELGDGANHKVTEIRKSMAVKFNVTPEELARKHKNNVGVFVNRVAWALHYLVVEKGPQGHKKAITKVSAKEKI